MGIWSLILLLAMGIIIGSITVWQGWEPGQALEKANFNLTKVYEQKAIAALGKATQDEDRKSSCRA